MSNNRSDLSVLFSHIRLQMSGVRQAAGALAYRDLADYYALKLLSPFNSTFDVQMLARNALIACDLDPSGKVPSVLDRPGQETRRDAAAAVLAAAIIKASSFPELTALYVLLICAGRYRARSELRKVLIHGDEIPARAHPRLHLKNFTSAGWQKQAYIDMTVEAYERAAQLLRRANTDFIARKYDVLLSSRVKTSFNRYFGQRSAKVDSKELEWLGNVPARNARLSHVGTVRDVLRQIYRVFFSDERIRIYFGGEGITEEDIAYSRMRSHRDLTRIHLSSKFFEYACDDRAGYLIHEMGHVWSFLHDHAYHDAGCRALARASPGKALTNADSYGWFVKTAFR